MTAPSSQLRREVMAQIIGFMERAKEAGHDPFAAARQSFPDVPISIVSEAWAEFDDQETERWWESLERTIDGEIIKNALTKT